jgi:ParB-like chromosome segregation protein Spo0J
MDRPTQPYLTDKLKPSPELLEIQPLMRISDHDRDNLKKDIQGSGEIRDPLKVYYDENGDCSILGGFNRWQIARELGFKYVPIQIYELKPRARMELAVNDNLNRRHLTTKQRQDLIGFLLRKDPSQSDKSIARKVGTTKETVKSQRKRLESGGEIRPVKEVRGADGKVYRKPEKLERPIQGGTSVLQREKMIKNFAAQIKEEIRLFTRDLTESEKSRVRNSLIDFLRKL